jgi:hypothetical protein
MKLFPLFISALCISRVALADTLSLNPVADTTISENNGARPDNMPGHMMVGHLQNANVPARGLLQFDLSGLPASSIVTSVTLTVTVTASASGGEDTHALHRMSAAWYETTATWIDSGIGEWATAGGDCEPSADATILFPAGPGTFTFTSTPALVDTVQMWATNSASNYGWVLRSYSEGGGRNARRFATREEAATLPQPLLTVGYTTAAPPLPTINITNPRVGDGKFKFDFVAEGGFSYVAQYKEALHPGDWTDFAWYPDPTVNTPFTVEDPLTATNRFYRVIVP